MQNIQFQTTQKAEQILQYVKKVINESELDLITACVYVHAHASELGETCGKLIPQQFTQFTLIWPSMLNISQPLLCELPKNYNIHISMFLSVFFFFLFLSSMVYHNISRIVYYKKYSLIDVRVFCVYSCLQIWLFDNLSMQYVCAYSLYITGMFHGY